jgi:hypothetical protein
MSSYLGSGLRCLGLALTVEGGVGLRQEGGVQRKGIMWVEKCSS